MPRPRGDRHHQVIAHIDRGTVPITNLSTNGGSTMTQALGLVVLSLFGVTMFAMGFLAGTMNAMRIWLENINERIGR